MSGPNASLSLPPGDRDDAPPLLPERERPAVAGSDPQPNLFAGLSPAIERISATLDEAQLALGELKLALSKNDLPTIKSAAWRLSEALMLDLRGQSAQLRRKVLAVRPRERQKLEA
jgi:hypothetical protein